jgi:succinate dehydrogenase/fumarate reductase flavoprotein subunit
MKMTRSTRSAIHAAGLLLRHLRDRMTHPRGTRLVLGQAVAGRLGESVFKLGIPLFLETSLIGISKDNGKVSGVRVDHKGVPLDIVANHGVVLATGGFPQDTARRAEHMPHVRAGARHFSMSPPASAGDAISLALEAGAHLVESNSNAAFWTPVSLLPGKDGPRPFPHLFLDRAKPGVIAVGRDGRRFTNEAASYHDFVQGMLGAGHHSAWLICDHRALRRYGLGAVRPFPAPFGHHLRSGYLKTGDTVEELAKAIDVPAMALRETIERFGHAAREGHDRDFGKGSTAYQTYLGDGENKPNPCLAPISKAPLYAIEIFPGDIGTSIGLETDANGRVLNDGGTPIGGLYTCGNDMNSIMAGAYPGAGITLGPALTFGFIVGRHAATTRAAPPSP